MFFEEVRDGSQRQSVVVTGVSDGIGRHICLKLAQAGCRLTTLVRNADRLAEGRDATQAAGAPEAWDSSCDR